MALVIVAAILAVLTALVFSLNRLRRPQQPAIPRGRIEAARPAVVDLAGRPSAAAHRLVQGEHPVTAGPPSES